ncbi:tol-pal system-associated acyl-CoA thioesterase [Sneathiella sp.]|uniref:tol-pal system-associated acyl-CoA thioesterase n=1 Tax=Sneathiella sp. TaxID=1964365 RepID=UPI002FDF4BEA
MGEPRMLGRFERVNGGGMRHIFPLAVYWEDTDAGGIVYYANYLKFTERARTDMLRGLGINQQRMLTEEGGAHFVVRACEIEYLRSARMEDELDVVTEITDVRGASLRMKQDIYCDGERLVTTKVRIACLDAEGRPQRLSSAINEKFNATLGQTGLPAKTAVGEE